MRLRTLTSLLFLGVLAPGCKWFDQPKRVDGIEGRVDELAEAVSELTGKPVAMRKKKAEAHGDKPEPGDGEKAEPSTGKSRSGARKARRGSTEPATPRTGAKRDDAHAASHEDEPPAADKDDPRDDERDSKRDDKRDDERDSKRDDERDAKQDDPRDDEHDDKKAHDAPHGGATHWDYEGEDGPKHWGDLDAAYAACATGTEQSPVDILPHRGTKDESVHFVYEPTTGTVTDNGHTLQVDLTPGSYAIVDGVRYDLIQFHVHTPSEHAIAGDRYPMEVHLVHKSKAGALAVVGILFTEGPKSPALSPVWKAAPKGAGGAKLKQAFDPKTLLPKDTSNFRYAGSLTTPPCSEGVRWIVLKRPQTETEAQIGWFQGRFGDNARPLQELGEREIE